MLETETVKNPAQGSFLHWFSGLFRLKKPAKMRQHMLLGSAMGLCLATMERGRQLETIMAGDGGQPQKAVTVMIPDASGNMVKAGHNLDHTEALTLQLPHVPQATLYANNQH